MHVDYRIHIDGIGHDSKDCPGYDASYCEGRDCTECKGYEAKEDGYEDSLNISKHMGKWEKVWIVREKH